MTRRVSRHGTVYTEGSSSTPAEDMPRTCASCGTRIYTSRESYQHHVDDVAGVQLAWHVRCPSPLSTGR